ncbi:MAG: hypothetical protein HOI56_01940 [Gammaproteobacteria bacterium]|jgi:hypothetical protein|nr:hypothetical protein [Gammaproteobacteria bacterium]MBT4462031.1 hypothetical protein [Gammaproteobacteria bacterium]MBT4654543.1 hypothetical protein [Gammaproteobacteria bacterium]MBT5117155.1 hypothetical protein [Gammaproteobacteria bacterium]MBT5761484.1 hypothetical protein [Gammaproteobacteria bacterium]
MRFKHINIISDEDDILSDDNVLNITFSKTIFNKYLKKNNIQYFFDINSRVSENKELSTLEHALYKESLNKDKRWYFLTYKYIYKYLVTYNQFYNRINYIIESNRAEVISITSNVSFILSRALMAIKEKHNIVIRNSNKKDLTFSYRHFKYMASDIPVKSTIDSTNLFLFILGLYLRLKGHMSFLFPSSCKFTSSSKNSLFRISYFSLSSKIKRVLLPRKKDITLRYFPLIDFSVNIQTKFKLTPNHWDSYRPDQISLIKDIINIYFNQYDFSYLDLLERKTTYLISNSGTKRVILDDTSDSYRKLMIYCCKKLNVDVEFLPHGLIDEEFQFPSIKDSRYVNHLPAVVAWNNNSSNYFNSYGLKSKAIAFPINMSKKITKNKKDILVMLSHGNRINLNSFEDDIETLIPLRKNLNYLIDWKIHHNIFDEANKSMNKQIKYIERTHDINLNFIKHDTKSSSIMSNYRKIIFTTWTTGIFEAALLNIPFIIFTKEDYRIHALNCFDIPMAKHYDDCARFILDNDSNQKYLKDIKSSLNNNMSFNDYLKSYG